MEKEISRFSDSLIFEGMTSIRAVIKAWSEGINDRKIKRVLFSSEKKKSRIKDIKWLEFISKEMGFDICQTSESEIVALSTGNSHGGIIAECTTRTIPKLCESSKIKENGFYVMIEGIEDPYNFGYAIRSLYACGVDGIVLSPRNWMSAAGVVCRSSAGASELLTVFESDTFSSADFFKKHDYKIVCAGIRNSISSFDADMKYPLYLIVGGEKRGISSSLLDAADEIVRIDYGREFMGSLSAASAASMLGYEVMRQNRKKALTPSKQLG